ncbi:MAG: DUF4446 family protein [Candidatus Shapirobacteria bacterium]|nr:DUF4446 family protein [Candidatus Shapirobacteria bacterium]
MANLGQLDLVIVGVIFFWLVFLSVIFYNLYNHYQKLTKGINKKNLKTVLDEILENLNKETLRIEDLTGELQKIQKENLYNIQKLGLVRFNPFAETGGNQSFSLAILDGEDSGLVLTSLHSREITRIYSKTVKKGKADNYELSAEEKQALKNAKKIK